MKVKYEPWTNGYAVGFKCIQADGRVSYLYLNPSDEEGTEEEPNVFLYQGPHGDFAMDAAIIHVVTVGR